MSDLISRQAAIDKAILIPIARVVTEDKVIWRKAVFVEDIEFLPSVQPEIIRCKDCKNYRPLTDQDDWCTYREMQVFEDDYCSGAERIEDETKEKEIKMKWEDFVDKLLDYHTTGQQQTNIKCPECGRNIYLDTIISYPGKYKYWCTCGWTGYANTRWEENTRREEME